MKAPLSLHGRLAALTIAVVCVPLGIATLVIYDLVTVVSDTMDTALDVQVRVLDQAIAPDGSFAENHLATLPELVRPRPGWGWRVKTPRGEWSRAFPAGRIHYPIPHVHPIDGIYSGYGAANSSEALHVRRLDRRLMNGPASVTVIAPSRLIDQPMERVQRSVRLMQALVLGVLVCAMALQLHFALRPLRILVKAVARVRSGEAQSLSLRQPAELAPLADEINSLIERNKAQLETARLNAANLAHAVKTPLASLVLQLEQEGASASSRALVEQISAQVAHHLRRARSAGGLGGRPQADAHAVVETIRPVLVRLRRDRSLEIDNQLPASCLVAVDHGDLGEMLGNLLENACRYAERRVRLQAVEEGGAVTLVIEDDGCGIPDDQKADVLQPGVRLDEVNVGYGFGLAIVRELVELYDGTLILADSAELGGLRTILRLPRPAASPV
ncbi:signal transduction histidine kinase [Novosphingobium sp. PhB165]|uniref:sensor histidine kinase n=1 Tax=Novosphingobium sp. PhB165 TaxID=2485105 RepID=UPI00104A2718|nr:HAMP domain-containing sensor histidine kinase [Novosphingobium sp. PhB165]TCM16584.1 signal transduction histidine kinase [Novosphingobium sp. PhB165]